MKIAEYPQRKCREPIQAGHIDYSCELIEFHPGPHATLSSRESVQRRDAWEAEHPGWEKMSDFGDPFQEVKP